MKKTILAMFVAAATLMSCSGDDSSSTPPNDDSVLLKKVIDTFSDPTVGSVTTDLTYDGNKLTELVVSDGYSYNYTYVGDLLTTIEDFDGSTLESTATLEYDGSNRLIKVTTEFTGANTIVDTFTHNSDGTVTENENGGAIYVYTFSNGNEVTQDHTNGDSDYTSVYDDKNGVFKNIHQREVFQLLGNYAFNNNLLSRNNTSGLTPNDNEETTYTYNSSNYPITAVTTLEAGTPNEETTNSQFFYE
ncbi:hypothetical protein [Pseudofulvibacter geojedonensis]|uniref:YD repeat-containing protein n=1 Tax=Pseudofulvibacter geojedonensis TaxID=1123758 RepID=A0ABW3I1X5_9FLAO